MNPRQTLPLVSTAFLALAASGLLVQSGPAVAQQTDEAMEEIVLEAPIMVREIERSNFGARTELIEIKRRISFADLDLSKHADVIELEARVETVSKETCKKLSEMFPLDTSIDNQLCVKKAMKSAENQLQAAIAAAN